MAKETLSSLYNGMRVVAVMQNKGGVGKTFLSTSLAVRAAQGEIPEVKKDVLLIDLDPQQNLSSTFLEMQSIHGEESKIPPIHPDYDPDDPEDQAWGGRSSSMDLYYGVDSAPYPTALEGVDILPADGNILNNFHAVMKQTTDEELAEALKNQLSKFFANTDVQEFYDLVIIDCPPGKGLIQIPVLRAVTDVIIPCETQIFCIDGTTQTVNLINDQNRYRYGPPVNIVGVIPNKHNVRRTINQNSLAVMRQIDLWRKYVPDFELRDLTEYQLSHLPSEVELLKKFKSKRAEEGMDDFIQHFRKSLYGKADSEGEGVSEWQ